ncbi:MAG: hypothetical protein ACFBWO_01405 [Paracoccaceae bacterium]
MPLLTAVIFALTALAATPAAAYIGPGVGAGTIAVVLGVIASVVMAFVAVLWYPIKRLLKKKPAPGDARTASSTATKAEHEG